MNSKYVCIVNMVTEILNPNSHILFSYAIITICLVEVNVDVNTKLNPIFVIAGMIFLRSFTKQRRTKSQKENP